MSTSIQPIAPEPNLWQRILPWIDFRDYIHKRRAVLQNPGPATSVEALFDWLSMSQFLVQGMIVPSIILLILIPLLPNYSPLHPREQNRAAKLNATIRQIYGQDSTVLEAQGHTDWARSKGGYAEWLQETVDREMNFRRWAIRCMIMALLVVPATVIVAAFVFPYRFPQGASGPAGDPRRVRAAVVYILGSHLFWLNAANAAVAALLFGLLEAVPSYYVILLFETAYLLLVVLILGTLTDRASMGLRIALQMPTPGKARRFFIGDSIKSDLVSLHFAVGLALTGLIRLVW